jgi:hypothetical protein
MNSEPRAAGLRNLAVAVALLFFVVAVSSFWYMVKCEGTWEGARLEDDEAFDLAAMKVRMREDVSYLQSLGPRNSMSEAEYSQLRVCEAWVKQRWESQGYSVQVHSFSVENRDYANLEIELAGRTAPSRVIVVSAQYDTLPGSPGANNNGSGLAVLFQLSELLRHHSPDKTLRVVAFVNEEDPFFGTEKMGSYQYARQAHQRGEDIEFMLSLDALGIYKDEPGTQTLPFPFSLFYPDRGNFLAFIGNLPSRRYITITTRGFRKGSAFPIRAGVVPEWVEGAGWSDHLSFWKFGYPAIQVTDTGAFRSASHTTSDDTMEKLNFDALSRIVVGMYGAIIELTEVVE